MINHLIGPISSAGSLLQCAWTDFTIKQWNWCGLQCTIPINFLYKDWWWSWKWYALHRYQSEMIHVETSYPLGSTVGAFKALVDLFVPIKKFCFAAYLRCLEWVAPPPYPANHFWVPSAWWGHRRLFFHSAMLRRISTDCRRVSGDTPSTAWFGNKSWSVDLDIPNSLAGSLKNAWENRCWFHRQETKRLSGLVCILAAKLRARAMTSWVACFMALLCGSTHCFFGKLT